MESVPVVEVDSTNASDVLPSVMVAIKTAAFVALDLEFSGLGNRKLLQSPNIEDRYKQICEVANSRSILAFGISCFKLVSHGSQTVYLAQSFNIFTMCMGNYIVEPCSIKFLLEHHFDFNRQYSKGLPYYRANMEHEDLLFKDIKQKKSKKKIPDSTSFKESPITTILKQLILAKKPIVMHNALVDLVFLYCSFYASPPQKLTQFISDCHSMFPGGLYDTKVIAEFKHHFQASYLDYVFKKCQRDNSRRQLKSRIKLDFVFYPALVSHYVTYSDLSLLDGAQLMATQSIELCLNYASHGWCIDGSTCLKSHSTDLVLWHQEGGINATKKEQKNKNNNNNKKKEEDEEGEEEDGNSKNNPVLNERSDCSDRPDCVRDGINEDVHENVCSGPAKNKMNGDGGHNGDNTRNDNLNNNNVINVDVNKHKDDGNGNIRKTASHGAGIDAFMTAYAFACFLAKFEEDEEGEEEEDEKREFSGVIGLLKGTRDYVNQLYLCGKDISLRVIPSHFSKPSVTNLRLIAACQQEWTNS